MKPNRIVITGGIASGKTEVTRYLREKGYVVIDADAIAHEVLELPTIVQEIKARFGDEVIRDGRVDHKNLAKLVFSNEKKRNALENILYPAIISEIVCRGNCGKQTVFYDIPLYFEKKERIPIDVDAIWLVYAEESMRLQRMQQNRGMTEEEARGRLAAQYPLERKIPLSDFVIRNEGTLEDLHQIIDTGLMEV